MKAKADMTEYMDEMIKTFQELGYETEVFENPNSKAGPIFLVADMKAQIIKPF